MEPFADADLQLYDSTYDHEQNNFPLFPRLPVELRFLIWEFSLHRHRVIKIKAPDHKRWPFIRNEFPVVPRHYILASELLRVNSESRQVALRFYRVHMHCNLKSGRKSKEGTLMFNPDFDVIQIKPNRDADSFAKLLYDLKSLDPQGVGVRRLALVLEDLVWIQWRTHIATMDPPIREWFIDIVAQLKSVWFIRRAVHGREPPRQNEESGVDCHQHESIMPKIVSFDPEAGDLRPRGKLFTNLDNHKYSLNLIGLWQELMDAWDITQPLLSRYRIIVPAECLCTEKVRNHAHAEQRLLKELRYNTCPKSIGYNLRPTSLPKNTFGLWKISARDALPKWRRRDIRHTLAERWWQAQRRRWEYLHDERKAVKIWMERRLGYRDTSDGLGLQSGSLNNYGYFQELTW